MGNPSSDTYRNPLKFTGQDYSFAPRYLRPRDPLSPTAASADIKPKEQQGYYPLGSLWTNSSNGNLWALAIITNNLAKWILISSAAGPMLNIAVPLGVSPIVPDGTGTVTFTSTGGTVDITGSSASPNNHTINFDVVGGGPPILTDSDDVGTKVTPDGTGNVQFVGHVVEQSGTFSTVVAGSHLLNINPMSPSRWIVDPLGFNGTHTTISSAITSASQGDTIILLPGVYTENLSFTSKAQISIVAQSQGQDFGVYLQTVIKGKITHSASGQVYFENIHFVDNSDNIYSMTGSNACLAFFNNCEFEMTHAVTAIVASNTSSSSSITLWNCRDGINNASATLFSISITDGINGNFIVYDHFSINALFSTTTSTLTSGLMIARNSYFSYPITVASGGTCDWQGCEINTSASINATCLTYAGTASIQDFNNCTFRSGTASAVSVSVSGQANLNNCTISSTNTNAITGAGTIKFSNISYENSAVVNTTTQVPFVISNNAIKVTAPGAYPYTVLATDEVVIVDTTSARTINLPASPVTGQKHNIKDNTGSAGANHITISPAAGNIDGAGSLTISTNFGFTNLVYNGTQWNVI